jgi:threonine dehydrogenase-like Zn-dependent dehydrogenase
VPFADVGAFTVPDGVTDERALFGSDSAATGWMGADLGGVQPGDVVAVWGAGAVGQMAARAAVLLGADRVIVIDRYDARLHQAEKYSGAETLNYERDDIAGELRDRSGGRGPDVCIEAVGMESHTPASSSRTTRSSSSCACRRIAPPRSATRYTPAARAARSRAAAQTVSSAIASTMPARGQCQSC